MDWNVAVRAHGANGGFASTLARATQHALGQRGQQEPDGERSHQPDAEVGQPLVGPAHLVAESATQVRHSHQREVKLEVG